MSMPGEVIRVENVPAKELRDRYLAPKVEQVLISGDLARLSSEERVSYYNAVCNSVGLNPLTQPFQYIVLNNKLTLYARRDCTDQLRKIHRVSITISSREMVGDVYVVTAQAVDKTGRCDTSIGAVTVGKLQGEAKANALMKAETKAKRRVTLSICGLGMLDETEVETVPGAVAPITPDTRFELTPLGRSGAPMTTPVEPGLDTRQALPTATPGPSGGPMVDLVPAPAEELKTQDDYQRKLIEEYTEPVNVYDKETGELVAHEPRLTSAQLAKIQILKRELGHHFDDKKYRKYLMTNFGKDSTADLSTREANAVLAAMERKQTKLDKTLAERTEKFTTDLVEAFNLEEGKNGSTT